MKTTHIVEQARNLLSFPLKKKGLFVTTMLAAVAASTMLGLATRNTTSLSPLQQNQVADTQVLERLNALQSQIQSLGETARKPMPEVNLTAITSQIEHLSKSLNELRESDRKHLTKTLGQTEATLGQELHSIKAVVNHLDAQKSPIKYLSVKELPFAIVSIDSIQQVPVASITYDYKTIPMEKGDSLAGWKIVSVDYGRQRIELENARFERIVVTQEHIG